jgi:hypothetical protein
MVGLAKLRPTLETQVPEISLGQHRISRGNQRPANWQTDCLECLHQPTHMLAAVGFLGFFTIDCIRAAAVPAQFTIFGSLQGDLVFLASPEDFPGGNATRFPGIRVSVSDAEVVGRRSPLPIRSGKEKSE